MAFTKRITLFQVPALGGKKLLPFSDDFNRADGVLGNGWEFTAGHWAIDTNRAGSIPTLGDELLTNGDFAAWTDDDPDNWTVSTEDANNYVTEDAAGARLVSNGTINFQQQVTLAAQNWMHLELVVAAIPDPSLKSDVNNCLAWGTVYHNIVARVLGASLVTSANPRISISQGQTVCDVTVGSVSLKPITYKDSIASREFGQSDVTLRGVINFADVYTVSPHSILPKTGFVMNLDDQDDPKNFVVVWQDGLAVRAQKCVNGTWSTIFQVGAAYGGTKVLKVIKLGGTYLFYYGTAGSETYLGLAQVTDASIIHNTRHGLFSLTEATWLNSFTAEKATKPDGVRIAGLGDSIMAAANSYYDRASSGYGTAISKTMFKMAHAAGGATIMAQMDGQAAAACYDLADIIIVNLGTNDNDAGNMTTLQAEVEENLAEIKASNPGVAIYYLNVLPRWTDSGGSVEVDKSHIRAAIAAACTAQSVTCWDSYTDPWITAAQTSDGCHPDAAGHQSIADRIIALLTA